MTIPPTNLNALTLPELFDELAGAGLIARLFQLARDEDLGPDHGCSGDITTQSWLTADHTVNAAVRTRQPGVISGLDALPLLSTAFAANVEVQLRCADGDHVTAGTNLALLSGSATQILALERTLLNLLSHLSGVATATSRYVQAIQSIPTPGRAKIFDTRKTAPGLRMLDKYAVRCGGGLCHRLGLYDAVLIKDNHLASIPPAQRIAHLIASIQRARSRVSLRFVEVETDSIDFLAQLLALDLGLVDIILLDNMSIDQLSQAVRLRDQANPSVQLEASGGITLETIATIAATGVDRISVGAITHSAPSLDIALDID